MAVVSEKLESGAPPPIVPRHPSPSCPGPGPSYKASIEGSSPPRWLPLWAPVSGSHSTSYTEHNPRLLLLDIDRTENNTGYGLIDPKLLLSATPYSCPQCCLHSGHNYPPSATSCVAKAWAGYVFFQRLKKETVAGRCLVCGWVGGRSPAERRSAR